MDKHAAMPSCLISPGFAHLARISAAFCGLISRPSEVVVLYMIKPDLPKIRNTILSIYHFTTIQKVIFLLILKYDKQN